MQPYPHADLIPMLHLMQMNARRRKKAGRFIARGGWEKALHQWAWVREAQG